MDRKGNFQNTSINHSRSNRLSHSEMSAALCVYQLKNIYILSYSSKLYSIRESMMGNESATICRTVLFLGCYFPCWLPADSAAGIRHCTTTTDCCAVRLCVHIIHPWHDSSYII